MLFNYRGRNKSGELITGSLDGLSADGVANQLLDKGVTPISIDTAPIPITFSMPDIFKPKLSLDELTMFCRQMYSLTRAGVVLTKAIRGLSQSVKNQRLIQVLNEVEASLNAGVNLSISLARHPDVFDKLFVSIIQVGENSGRLDLAFKQMAQYLELEKNTRRQIKAAVRYPIFVLVAISIAIVVLNIWVIPVFADLFSKFGADLPLPTKILIGMSSFFINYWPILLLALLASIAGIYHYLNTEAGLLRWDRIRLRIPLIGSIVERATLARYSRSFSLMLKSGVPLIQALELCSQAVGNTYLAIKIMGMREHIERGESLFNAAVISKMFTPLVLQMIQVGEETGRVDEQLQEVAEFYEQEVEYDLQNLSAYIEPILIVCIAGLVIMLALGIFLPMWDMMNVMQG
ncbi:MAG: type II secretion system F family protein [Spongiibacteraceae bacterium]|nr:type II secretion system F family protein [Spongiibacteraceae bacterium]